MVKDAQNCEFVELLKPLSSFLLERFDLTVENGYEDDQEVSVHQLERWVTLEQDNGKSNSKSTQVGHERFNESPFRSL